MERIFINGIEIEREAEKAVSLVYQSPYFTDIDFIVSNRTTSVDIPRTPNNMRAVEYAGAMQGTSLFEYNIHKVVYERDGVQLFKGTATLLSISPTSYKFTFAWGNISAFQQMLDTNLRDLQTEAESDYIGYNSSTVASNRTYYPNGWNTVSNWGYEVDGLSVQPIMPVAQIMSRLAERFGVSFSFPEGRNFDKYRIPIVTRYGDEKSASWQGVKFIRGGLGVTYQGDGGITYLSGTAADRSGGLDVNEGIINTQDINTLVVEVSRGFQTKEEVSPFMLAVGLRVMAITYEGADAIFTTLATIPTQREYHYNDGEAYYTYTVERDASYSVDVSEWDEVVIAVAYKAPTSSILDDSTLTQVEVVSNPGVTVYDPEADTVEYGGTSILPLFANLPDMSVADFLKNLMKIEGVFAYSNNDSEVVFVSLDYLYNNRAQAQDWSDKMMTTNGLPTEMATAFNSLAQKNWMRYAEDEQVPTSYNGYIVVYSALLEQENDLIEEDFAPTQGNSIGVWVQGANGVEWNDVEPRILREQADGSISFNGMGWDSLIASNYATYQSTVLQPRTVKVGAVITTADLLAFDFTRPIYVKQWGHYYAVTKLTTKDNHTADVELLQLGTFNS